MILAAGSLFAQPADKAPVYTPTEQVIVDGIKSLRDTPDTERGAKTTTLALEIRTLPIAPNKLRLAVGLTHLSTEGDFGHQALQTVADTLTQTLIEQPQPAAKEGDPAPPYIDLAKLVRYEHVTTTLETPQYIKAVAALAANEVSIEKADFTLKDLQGKEWTLSALRGKVVLVNFWATWCPPCRKEMPDLDTIARKYADQSVVVLSISDEDAAKVNAYVVQHNLTYPILLDPERKTNVAFHIEGIPQSFVFNREGKLVAQSIDMRTMGQFQQMLAAADVK
ncbi:MAG: TlpA disulfide reductase family protein [Edaphobacter sp.]|uniref:TlpA disulfide reductase family protein n=1 Tax=Edaphobacter sp. TaxID=1934404 RepID=UPI002392BA75|nr:TlpA disulfide reductase family protein [Edaphobacter sp.]MDE1178770.1 TlpA disulfide reductase family protein [Edaphobacter sp.]